MATYEIPRNVKGEGRILFIFTPKSIIYTAVFGLVGILFFSIIKGIIGIIIALIFAALGYGIATLTIPESNRFEITRKTGGEKIDATILKLIKFKTRGKRLYLYTKEENKCK